MSSNPPTIKPRKRSMVTVKQEADVSDNTEMPKPRPRPRSRPRPKPRPEPEPIKSLSSNDTQTVLKFANKPVLSSTINDPHNLLNKKKMVMMSESIDEMKDMLLQKKHNVLNQKRYQMTLEQEKEMAHLEMKKEQNRKLAFEQRKKLELPLKNPITTFDRNQKEQKREDNDLDESIIIKGQVRATPYGAQLKKPYQMAKQNPTSENLEKIQILQQEAHNWRNKMKNLPKISFPVEGFNHTYGQSTIDYVDSIHKSNKHNWNAEEKKDSIDYDKEDQDDQDEDDDYGATKAAMAAVFTPNMDVSSSSQNPTNDGHEYGHEKSPLDAPVKSLKDKWRLLPHFLALRSLMRQHIDSFDHFVSVEMKQIVQSPSACEIRSDHDPKFYLRYTDCWYVFLKVFFFYRYQCFSLFFFLSIFITGLENQVLKKIVTVAHKQHPFNVDYVIVLIVHLFM